MKHIFLIASLFVCTTYNSHAIKKTQQKNAQQCVPVRLIIEILESDHHRYGYARYKGSNHKDNQPLATHYCIKGVDWDDLTLIQQGIQQKANINYANPDNNNLNFIQIACRDKNADTVAALLKAPDINLYAHEQGTMPPFHLALFRGDENIINLLLAHDMRVLNSRDERGNNALHTACRNGDTKKAQFLLNKGICPTIKNNYNKTPLAAAYFNTKNFRSFYSKDLKSLVLKKTKNRNTQLHLATLITDLDSKQFDNYIAFLLAQGLSLWSRNKKNKLPVDIAYKKYAAINKKYVKQLYPTKEYKQKHPGTVYYMNVIDKELILHSFLRFNTLHMQCALLTHLLQEQLKDSFGNIPKELQTYIARIYYTLHKETLIAHKYKNDWQYYKKAPHEKKIIKNKLLNNPEPQFLWRTQ